MDRVKGIKKLTNNRFLNLYELDAQFRDGSAAPYYVASRRKTTDALKAATHDSHPDGVILYGVYGENKDKVVLVRQFRYPINGYVYEFPAGLVEPGEDMLQAGIREMYEETGLEFTPADATAQDVYFVIDDPELAQISDNGVLQALRPGETVLRVFSGNGKYSDRMLHEQGKFEWGKFGVVTRNCR